jgi:hypothetical protein
MEAWVFGIEVLAGLLFDLIPRSSFERVSFKFNQQTRVEAQKKPGRRIAKETGSFSGLD